MKEREDQCEDRRLLRLYVRRGSQAAFSRLAARHLKLVYSTCLRELRDPDMAEDVTQAVFLLLARKAQTLQGESQVSGWLFRTAYFASRNVLRQERRRGRREAQILGDAAHGTDRRLPENAWQDENARWNEVGPRVNAALSALGPRERDAVLMRFGEELSFPEMAAALETTEDAARMRVSRAVGRLRRLLAREAGLSEVIVMGFLAESAHQTVPCLDTNALAHMAAAMTAGGASLWGVSPVPVYAEGVLHAMKVTKIKLALAGMSGALAVGLPLFAFAGEHQRKPAPGVAIRPYEVPSPSMEPTLRFNTTVSVRQHPYQRVADVRRGDVVTNVVKETLSPGKPESYSAPYLSRVVGLPGDTVRVSGLSVWVNGQKLPHQQVRQTGTETIFRETSQGASYTVAYQKRPSSSIKRELTAVVPAGTVFLLGDNRDDSYDSRYRGASPFTQIVGKMVP